MAGATSHPCLRSVWLGAPEATASDASASSASGRSAGPGSFLARDLEPAMSPGASGPIGGTVFRDTNVGLTTFVFIVSGPFLVNKLEAILF